MAEKDILRGWKEIEEFVGMNRKAILSNGYPVRCEGGACPARRNIFAVRQELLEHALTRDRVFFKPVG